MVKEIGKGRYESKGSRHTDRDGSSSRDRSSRDKDRSRSSSKGRDTVVASTVHSSQKKSLRVEGSDGSRLKSPPTVPDKQEKQQQAAAASGVSTPEYVLSKKDMYEQMAEFENEEAKDMELEEEFTDYQETFVELIDIINQIMTIKESGNTNKEELKELKTEGALIIMGLKRLNRLFKLRLKNEKDEAMKLRALVDSDHLVLQNLLYEATHLSKQVAAVQEYKGMDEKINLVPLDEFYDLAPDNISKPNVTKYDDHLLRIARLEFEFTQRTQLTEQCNSLERDKLLMTQKIEETQAKMDNIKPLLDKILEATMPVQAEYGIGISASIKLNKLAKLLPAPLYVLYVQSTGFQDANAGKIKFVVNIGGDQEKAKELVVTPDQEAQDESDSEMEQDDNEKNAEADMSSRRQLHKHNSMMDTSVDPKDKVLQKHPLNIEWTLQTKLGDSIVVEFYYMLKLRIVTIKTKVVTGSSTGKISESIMHSEHILNDLFDNDGGLTSPNPCNSFVLQKADIDNLADYTHDVGLPYIWAQKLGGLDFATFHLANKNDTGDLQF